MSLSPQCQGRSCLASEREVAPAGAGVCVCVCVCRGEVCNGSVLAGHEGSQ